MKLRDDEREAWMGFITAAPQFTGEKIASWVDGPDPPDVLCMSASGKKIGVELTKWVQQAQLQDAISRKHLEDTFLTVIASENQPRPEDIGCVHLHDRSLKIAQKDARNFRCQVFELLAAENGKPAPVPLDTGALIPAGYWNTVQNWNNQQGAKVSDFAAYPTLKKYLKDLWIFPRQGPQELLPGEPWICFELNGGSYSPNWMAQAACCNTWKKIIKYETEGIPAKQGLDEFYLVCFYCDEALLNNTPIGGPGFGFEQIAAQIERALSCAPRVFDGVFLYHPHEKLKVLRVYHDHYS
jgi:hypothetical protein